ncbi:MAG: succinate dehydrogenase / fumarate reductase cytochrome b subunit [Candidatus Aldehydirespiratoraceae bacterium]|jgi:succinate dehydrogenase / fumarate reductase cytochrome b subunit
MAQTLSRGPVSGTAVKAPEKKKPFVLDLYGTAVGKKYVMAITGLIGLGFIVTHMIGNLKMYLGPIMEDGERVYDIDIYGEFLRDLAVPLLPRTYLLWGLRLILIGAVLLHIHAAVGLTRMNHKARSVKYQSPRDYQVANFASRSMRYTGSIVLLFIIWHLADLTWGATGADWVRGDVYYNIDQSLSRIPVAAIYIIANVALGVHLFHGIWSLFQSLGWSNPKFNAWRRNVAIGTAALIVAGNVSFPIAVMAGVIEYDPTVVSVHDLHNSAGEE